MKVMVRKKEMVKLQDMLRSGTDKQEWGPMPSGRILYLYSTLSFRGLKAFLFFDISVNGYRNQRWENCQIDLQ